MSEAQKRYPTRLLLESMYNVRDLGGYQAKNGQVTAFGRFLRSDAPGALTRADLRLLLDYPVRTVIDLRSPSEHDDKPYVLLDSPDIDYFNIPLLGFDMMASIMAMNESDDPYIAAHDLYIRILTKARDPIGQVFSRLAAAKPGACLFHCTHGKDRTGIIAALLLLLAGVSKEDIIANYQTSATFLKPWFDTFISELPAEILHFFKTDPETMEITLEFFRKSYVSVDDYLLGCGVSEQDIHLLRQKLLA